MIIWIRNLIVIFAILTVIYGILTVRGRRRERERLGAEYTPDSGVDQRTYIADGLAKYQKSLRVRLMAGIFGLPLLIAIILLALAFA